MKRPASVLATLILFGLFILIGILTMIKNSPSGITAILAGSIMPILFLIGWFGVFLMKNWARVYSTIVIVLFGLLVLALPFIMKGEQSPNNELIVLIVIMVSFMGWWAYCLGIGKASKNYFQGNQDA